jgi:hypothetical protein
LYSNLSFSLSLHSLSRSSGRWIAWRDAGSLRSLDRVRIVRSLTRQTARDE